MDPSPRIVKVVVQTFAGIYPLLFMALYVDNLTSPATNDASNEWQLDARTGTRARNGRH